ncbi:hypothetical protein [Lysobacter gummosus]
MLLPSNRSPVTPVEPSVRVKLLVVSMMLPLPRSTLVVDVGFRLIEATLS